AGADSGFDAPPGSLAAKVRGPAAVRRLLARIQAAEDLRAAVALLPGLDGDEKVVTRAGERAGPGWVQVLRERDASQGALLREREIQELRAAIEALQAREQELEARLAELRDALLAAEQQREEAQRSLYMAHRGVS